MKKILFITNFANKSECDNKITSFSRASYEAAKKQGMEFHINTNKKVLAPDDDNIDVHYHYAGIYRNPFSKDVIKAYQELCEICRKNQFDVIHCNTPIGGVLGRIIGKKYKVPKVIYQAHGFHFYKGAPLKNWLVYYPIERWLAHYTNAIITINTEDYKIAQGFKLRKGGKVYYVPGVGIDLSQYEQPESIREIKRKELNLKETDVALISAGELNTNKNNSVIIEALSNLQNKNVHYFLCGIGPCEDVLKELAQKNGITEQVHFLGYRTDIKELFRAADIFVMPSFREGLSRSIMEAMASGLPCVVSKIRGNVELIEEGKGGYLCNPSSSEEFSTVLKQLSVSAEERKELGKYNLINVKKYDVESIIEKLESIYFNLFNDSI